MQRPLLRRLFMSENQVMKRRHTTKQQISSLPLALATAGILLVALVPTAALHWWATRTDRPASNTYYRQAPGLDLTIVPAAYMSRVLDDLNSSACTCGCKMNIAYCRNRDPACKISRRLGQEVIERTLSGPTSPNTK